MPEPAPALPDSEPTRSPSGRIVVGFLVLAAIASILASASVGRSPGFAAAALSAIYLLLSASYAPILYLVGALGFGVPLQRAIMPHAERFWAIRTGLGLAAMLTLTHLLGIFGVLDIRAIAIGLPVLGVVILVVHLARHPTETQDVRARWPWLAAMPAIGVLLVAACNPPGWLWASEFGGYDVLSYHLQLPREWLNLGQLWPVQHNVYSFLPSYIEGAYLHIAVVMDATPGPSLDGTPTDLIAGDGSILIAAQFLHVGLTLIAGLLIASATTALIERCGRMNASVVGALAGALAVATPWIIVTGSMAYNEMGLVALFAAAMLVALERDTKPWHSGLAAGILIGAACGCKPTAIFLAAPVVGITMLAANRPKYWPVVLGAAMLGGSAMLAPWFIRNWLACGNPVFPRMTGLFGSAHWSSEQVARFSNAHSFQGPFSEAMKLLILPESSSTGMPNHRGLMHAQWGIFAPVVLIAAVASVVSVHTRKWGSILTLGLASQILAWLVLTHIQSRFLIPLVVPGAMLFGLAISTFPARVGRIVPAAIGAAIVFAQSLITFNIFAHQRDSLGGANVPIAAGARFFTSAPDDIGSVSKLPPIPYLNTQLPIGSRVLFVGSATPMYCSRDLAYSTTWDTSPLVESARAWPDAPEMWLMDLKAKGFTHVYLNAAELDRLRETGWADPDLNSHEIGIWLNAVADTVYIDARGPYIVYELP
ncbi:MAG TPA: hypothetical protein ENJ00_03950 [Phycisphaerales bacterium]|nr:hypothetical protein [Phycisphaerales bacterium]